MSSPLYLSVGEKYYQHDIKSFKELKEEGLVLQTDEFTCGAAALATLLTKYGPRPVSEEELLLEEKELEEGKGLSLLQLKRLAESHGFKASGYKLELANLFDLGEPMLLHVDFGHGGHYVEFQGVYKDRVYLGDPAAGNVRMGLESFAQAWSGYALVFDGIERDFDPPTFAQPELITVRNFKR